MCFSIVLVINHDKRDREILAESIIELKRIAAEYNCDMNPIIRPDGTQEWYQKDKLHREDGPAVIHADGTQEWWQNNKRHRVDGPAIIRPDGAQAWFQNGQLHRDDGPAIIDPDGSQAWWQNGINITDLVKSIITEYNLRTDYSKWSDTDKVFVRLAISKI